ncbi:ATP-binding protein [Streptomyces sp. NPDC001719]
MFRAATGTARTTPEERFRELTLYAESSDTGHVARDMVRSTLDDWELNELVDDALLVVSELVGNAVHHSVPDECLARPGAPRRIHVTITQWPKWLIFGVADEDCSPPTVPLCESFSPYFARGLPEAVLPDSGRGLLIIQSLVDALWWTPREGGGKSVFCCFDLVKHSCTEATVSGAGRRV